MFYKDKLFTIIRKLPLHKFFIKPTHFFITSYITGISTYGFYRGYANTYPPYCILHNDRKPPLLYTDKFTYGLYSMIYHINPISQIPIIYGICVRFEKTMRNIPIENIDNKW
jgi:hypothetical protein